MNAAGPFRWLLTLVAMVMPFAAATCRASGARDETVVRQEAVDHVVFRHYL